TWNGRSSGRWGSPRGETAPRCASGAWSGADPAVGGGVDGRLDVMAGQRIQRIREEIKREASDIIRKLKDPRVGFVTVTDVEVSGDLRHVKIFVSVLGDDEAKARTMEALTRATGYILTEIGQRIRLRHTPEIHIKPDESVARGARIFELVREVGSAGTKETGAECTRTGVSSKPSLPATGFSSP